MNERLIDKFSLTLSRYWFLVDQKYHYAVSTWIFLRLLAGIYFMKFYSISLYIQDWIGNDGIHPVRLTLTKAKEEYSILALLKYPTFFWYGSNDFFISLLIWTALVASILLFFCVSPGTCLIVLYICF